MDLHEVFQADSWGTGVKLWMDLHEVFQADSWGTGVIGLTSGLTTLPQSNEEHLMVADKVGRPPR